MAFCEAVCGGEAAAGALVAFQVAPGLRVDGHVLRKCRVVLRKPAVAAAPQPRAATPQ